VPGWRWPLSNRAAAGLYLDLFLLYSAVVSRAGVEPDSSSDRELWQLSRAATTDAGGGPAGGAAPRDALLAPDDVRLLIKGRLEGFYDFLAQLVDRYNQQQRQAGEWQLQGEERLDEEQPGQAEEQPGQAEEQRRRAKERQRQAEKWQRQSEEQRRHANEQWRRQQEQQQQQQQQQQQRRRLRPQQEADENGQRLQEQQEAAGQEQQQEHEVRPHGEQWPQQQQQQQQPQQQPQQQQQQQPQQQPQQQQAQQKGPALQQTQLQRQPGDQVQSVPQPAPPREAAAAAAPERAAHTVAHGATLAAPGAGGRRARVKGLPPTRASPRLVVLDGATPSPNSSSDAFPPHAHAGKQKCVDPMALGDWHSAT
jgi:hypothetical protein